MEVLFVIVVILIAYMAYSVLDKGGEAKKATPAAVQKPEASRTSVAPAAAEVKTEPKQVKTEETQPVAAATVSAASTPTVEKSAATSLRDPKSGEVSTVPANYRFAKRWIKDALVAEGLLDKVYKNNELDDANSAKVKAALDALRSMPKYQA